VRGMACHHRRRRRGIGLLLALALLLAMLGAAPAVAAPLPGHPQSSGATYYYSLPDGAWQDLVVYAHGYISPYAPPWTPETDSIEGTTLGQIVTGMGYAFATTTYPGPGLIVPQAVEDVARLVGEFAAEYGSRDGCSSWGPPRADWSPRCRWRGTPRCSAGAWPSAAPSEASNANSTTSAGSRWSSTTSSPDWSRAAPPASPWMW